MKNITLQKACYWRSLRVRAAFSLLFYADYGNLLYIKNVKFLT